MRNHTPVLLRESLDSLAVNPNSIVLDATLGTGGHAIEIINTLQKGTFVGIDADISAINQARENIGIIPKELTAHFVNDNFANIVKITSDLGIKKYNCIFADLGWGSHQIASGRGFSFTSDEVLDMCYSSNKDDCRVSALDVVNSFGEKELREIIEVYGEERWATRITKYIVSARKQNFITTTGDLKRIIEQAVPRQQHPKNRHIATKTFQAIRIAVNDEIVVLRRFLKEVKSLVGNETHITIISFHSLEDRIVKQTFKEWELEKIGIRYNKKPIQPSEKEVSSNPRARSAKLRTFIFNSL